MRILPKTSRETKSEFFGKHSWTFHTTLVFQKINEDLDIQAYDHWSSNIKQDAYHWYCWYNVEVHGWIFLELGKAKMTITHVIKRYIRVGCDLIDGTNIKMAFQDLSGTSIAHIEPNQDQFNIRANSS
ncbi:hypothetical protein GLOIN_2v1767205 [Rhizophagus irregularis DAOM 181602=DAOM 197198]|nr:hypothetical protein GLOIN_2v1767205 [Rhizophagus irregularis DAOM 181602=DAOM 197198]